MYAGSDPHAPLPHVSAGGLVRAIASEAGRDAQTAWWLFATAWSTLVLLVRPFSNSVESLCLCCLVYTAMRGWRQRRTPSTSQWMAAGVLLAVGTFVRITFPLFAAVPLLMLAVRQHGGLARVVFIAAAAFGATSASFIAVDTLHFEQVCGLRCCCNGTSVWVTMARCCVCCSWL